MDHDCTSRPQKSRFPTLVRSFAVAGTEADFPNELYALSGGCAPKDVRRGTIIPFWEFLDIEFDNTQRLFRFVAYYRQQPSFPHLFERLIGSPALRKVADEIECKATTRIYKQDWKRRSDLEFELGAQNVIYMLIDTTGKRFYIGEAADLIKRLTQPHSSIPNWTHFRYSVLPAELGPYRVALERMLIKDFAAVLKNKRDIFWYHIGDCELANDKVDL